MDTESDTAAFWGPVVEAHHHTVVLSLLALGLTLDRAQDVAHKTWARLIEKKQRSELPHLEFPGLALRQSRFIALDEFKRDRAEGRALATIGAAARVTESLEASPEHRALARQDLQRAVEAITFCSSSAQRVFRAVYEDPGVPHAVVAERFGLSVQRVRQILCEVRRKVRLALEDSP